MNTKDTPMDYKQFEGHTPGPWSLTLGEGSGRQIKGVLGMDEIKRNLGEYTLRGDVPVTFATDVWVQFQNKEWIAMQDANFKLMVAAPDLLKENQELKLELQKQKELNAELVKGLRKARNYVSQGADMFESATDAQHIKEEFQTVVKEIESLIKKSSEI